MTAPKPPDEKWDPMRETYDEFRLRVIREAVREVLAEPRFAERLAKRPS